jgi:hypothetical protein
MSLAIDPESVTAVLLADGWHNVNTSTFTIGTYEFVSTSSDVEGYSDGPGFTFGELNDDGYRSALCPAS